MQRPVFFARGIIITSYLPIFTLQAVEGRLFKPMAWTVCFALIGAADLRHPRRTRNGQPPLQQRREGMAEPAHALADPPLSHRGPRRHCASQLSLWESRLALFAIAIYLAFGGPIGSEFLPHLDEGSIWVRGTLPPSEGPTASIDFTNKARARHGLIP